MSVKVAPQHFCGYTDDNLRDVIKKCGENENQSTRMLARLAGELLAYRSLCSSNAIEREIDRAKESTVSWAKDYASKVEERAKKAAQRAARLRVETGRLNARIHSLESEVESLRTQLSDVREDLHVAEENYPSEEITIKVKAGRIHVCRKAVKS